jgi:hypothetical protein
MLHHPLFCCLPAACPDATPSPPFHTKDLNFVLNHLNLSEIAVEVYEVENVAM